MLCFQVIIVQMVRKSLTSIPVLLVPLTTVQDYAGTQNVQLVKVCYISFLVEIVFSYIFTKKNQGNLLPQYIKHKCLRKNFENSEWLSFTCCKLFTKVHTFSWIFIMLAH
jgi:hypothetical protein